MIKPAHKMGAIVVMDTKSYVEDAHRQLSDTEVYRTLTSDPKWAFEKILSISY